MTPRPAPAGLQRVSATRAAGKHGGWTTEVRWTTTGLKPYFNDFVAHEGHAYGFDGSILASVDLETGERAWKGGRYGHGQLLLLADQGLLLVPERAGRPGAGGRDAHGVHRGATILGRFGAT